MFTATYIIYILIIKAGGVISGIIYTKAQVKKQEQMAILYILHFKLTGFVRTDFLNEI